MKQKIRNQYIFLLLIIASFGIRSFAQNPELVLQTGHTGNITALDFSTDSKYLVSGSRDYTVRFWDIKDGLLRTFSGHKRNVNAVSLSADTKFIASGGDDHTLRIWDVKSGAELKVLKGHNTYIKSIDFSPDGKLVVSGDGNGVVKIWDVETGKQIKSLQFDENDVRLIKFSPDGKYFAAVTRKLNLWNLLENQESSKFKDIRGVVSLDFSPDGLNIALTNDHDVEIWDLLSGTKTKVLKAHENNVRKVAFLSANSLISAGDDNILIIWDPQSGKQLKSLTVSSEEEDFVTSPDGKLYAFEHIIRNKEPSTQNNENGITERTYHSIKLASTSDTKEIKILGGKASTFSSITFSPDKYLMASGNGDSTNRFWNLADFTNVNFLNGLIDPATPVVFSPDGEILATAVEFYNLVLWNTTSKNRLKTLEGHTGVVQALSFSADGKKLASCGYDNTVKIWNVEQGILLKSIENAGVCRLIKILPDGQNVAVYSDVDGEREPKIFLWKIGTGESLPVSAPGISWFKNDVEKVNEFESFVLKDGYNREILVKRHFNEITFFRNDTKKELCKLFAIGKSDWLLVTPDGLFDGTPAGWKNLIWRFNNNTFDYTSVEAFFSEFYRPGLLNEIIKDDIPTAPQNFSKLDRRQPEIEISLPETSDLTTALNSRQQAIQVRVSEVMADKNFPSGEVRDIRLFRNNSLVKIWRGQTIDEIVNKNKKECSVVNKGEYSGREVICKADMPILAGTNQLTAYSFNRDNIKSPDSEFSIEGAQSLQKKGTIYILAIGINKYAASLKNAEGRSYDLSYAISDVETVSKEIISQQAKLNQNQFSDTKIITLLNDNAVKSNILLALKRFSKNAVQEPLPVGLKQQVKIELEKIRPAQPEDALIVYYAGHGIARCTKVEKNKQVNCDRFYLIPHDGFPSQKFENSEDRLKNLYQSSVSDEEIADSLENVDVGKMLMVIDACNSGAIEGEEKRRGPMNTKGLAQVAYEKGIDILTASQSYQSALEGLKVKEKGGRIVEIQHGLLTYALLNAFKDKNADQDANQKITEFEWLNYGVSQVPALQLEAMAARSAESPKGKNITRRTAELIPSAADKNPPVQTPRLFTRRETSINPFIIAVH